MTRANGCRTLVEEPVSVRCGPASVTCSPVAKSHPGPVQSPWAEQSVLKGPCSAQMTAKLFGHLGVNDLRCDYDYQIQLGRSVPHSCQLAQDETVQVLEAQSAQGEWDQVGHPGCLTLRASILSTGH